jgi:hypothetical protein
MDSHTDKSAHQAMEDKVMAQLKSISAWNS